MTENEAIVNEILEKLGKTIIEQRTPIYE